MDTGSVRRNVRITRDLHPAVYGALVFCMLWSLLAVWISFGSQTYAALQLAVATFFGAVFTLVPLWLLRLGRKGTGVTGSFGEWARSEFETAAGTCEAAHAAGMVLIAPVAVAVGLSFIGFIASLAARGAL